MAHKTLIFCLLLILTIISHGCCDNNTSTTETISTTATPFSTATSIETTLVSTSTTSPTTTRITETSASPNSNSTKSTPYPSSRSQFVNTSSYACSCDLMFHCDVNCCCDIDCNAEITAAFDCLLGVDIDDFHYGEGLERCDVNGGLLCIAHDNVPSIDQKLHIPYHPEYSSYKWPKFIQPHDLVIANNELSSRDFYKFGDAILTYDKSSDKYQTINIPAMRLGDTSNCFLTEPVMFLKSKSIKCLRSYRELCTYNNNLMKQLMHTRLFHRPPKSTQETSEAFSIVIESCKHTFNNCTQISSIIVVGDRSINSQLGSVEEIQEYDDVYEDIEFIFHINDTKIVSAIIKFRCHNELVCSNNDELESTKFIQNIQVNFININENRMERRIRKRRRGFNDDELIVISRRRPLNESITMPMSSTEMIFDYFRNETLEHMNYIMKLPEIGVNGKCLMDDTHYDTIRFNENSHTFCTVELTRDITSNFTICQQFQHQLMAQLFHALNLTLNYTLDGYTSDVYVSKFWTPQYDRNAWTHVSFYNIPIWSPEMQESEKIVSCSNLITSANYKFLYSTVKASSARKYEHFIENLIVEFGKLDELHIEMDDENLATQNIEIQINVQFVNLFHKNFASAAADSMANIFNMIFCILSASLASLPYL